MKARVDANRDQLQTVSVCVCLNNCLFSLIFTEETPHDTSGSKSSWSLNLKEFVAPLQGLLQKAYFLFRHLYRQHVPKFVIIWKGNKSEASLRVKYEYQKIYHLLISQYEPWHDKTNKMSVRPAKTQISLGGCPGWSESSLGAQSQKAWALSYPLSAQRRLWSDWADAQADLSLRWVHSHFAGFVMSRLIYLVSHI